MKPPPVHPRVTLQDIAAATGYTVNTVSRALQNKADIAKSTCEHIQQVADGMGYVRNRIASALRSGRSHTLAVIVGGMSNPFYACMTDAIHDFAASLGYAVLVLCSRDGEAQERAAILSAMGRQVDGVLLFPGNRSADNLTLMRDAGLPFVLVSRRLDGIACDSVVCDEAAGGYLAGRHLTEAGHRKLAFFDACEVTYSTRERKNGFQRAAREAGIPPEAVLCHRRGSDADTLPLLRRWQAEHVTGIFTFCDIEAWQLIALLDACGMSEAFGIVGFDNIQSLIGFPAPQCTVDGALRDVAAAAVRLLIGRLEGDTSAPQQLVYPVRLVCRGSCSAHPAAPGHG